MMVWKKNTESEDNNTMNKRRITAEDLYDLEVLLDCQISPDGEKIIYVLQTVEKKVRRNFLICGCYL